MGEARDRRRRQGEEMLLESAVWTADLGAYEWDVRTDRVRWLNRWCQYYDLDPCEGERHGERWRALVHPEDRVQRAASTTSTWPVDASASSPSTGFKP